MPCFMSKSKRAISILYISQPAHALANHVIINKSKFFSLAEYAKDKCCQPVSTEQLKCVWEDNNDDDIYKK